jgi:hypothetical protein
MDDVVFYNLTFFGANMSCEHKKGKKLPRLLKKTVVCLKKTVKNLFFFDFLEFQAPGADICAPNFKNS